MSSLKPKLYTDPMTGRAIHFKGDNFYYFIFGMIFFLLGITLLLGAFIGNWGTVIPDTFVLWWALSIGGATNLFWLIVILLTAIGAFFLGEADLY